MTETIQTAMDRLMTISVEPQDYVAEDVQTEQNLLGRLVLHRKCGAFRFSDEQYCRFVKEVEGFCYTLI